MCSKSESKTCTKAYDALYSHSTFTERLVRPKLCLLTHAHDKLDLSPVNDLWSALFIIIDMSTNALPYIRLKNQSKLHRETVVRLKHEFVDFMTPSRRTSRAAIRCACPTSTVAS